METIFAYGMFLALMSQSSVFASVSQAPQVLVVLSGSDFVSTKEGTKHATGYYLSELAGPLSSLLKAGYGVIFATPDGHVPAMDRSSDDPKRFPDQATYLQAKELIKSQRGMKKPLSLSSLTEKELNGFAGIFVPGGHAPMEDLASDKNMGRILQYFHDQQKPTALICHGPAALLSARTGSGAWAYAGYKVTGFSTVEEKQMEDAGNLGGHLKFYLEDEMSRLGGKYSSGNVWTSHVEQDRELVTAQNPMSERAFTEAFLKLLTERRFAKAAVEVLSAGVKIQPGVLYEILGASLDWDKGYTTLFIGSRRSSTVSPKEYLKHMGSHVPMVADKLLPLGLQGYVIYVAPDYEIAYQNWTTKAAMEAAFATADGKGAAADAGTFMDAVLFGDVARIPDWVRK